MSLKFSHILFITISSLMCFAIAAWEYVNFRATGGSGHALGVAIAAMSGVALIVYGFWFLKKTRRLIL